jgi:transposase
MGPSLFKSDAFNIEVESGRAVCPAGHLQDKCSQFPDTASGKMIFEFVWYKSCAKCPLAHQCLGAGKKRRVVRAGLFHSYLQQRRREQITDEFKEKMKRRNGIEGTHSELIRGHGLRHARYRGRAKMQLQGYFTAAACNIKRWFRRIQWLNEIETELQPS